MPDQGSNPLYPNGPSNNLGPNKKYPTMTQEAWDRFYSYTDRSIKRGGSTEQDKWRYAPENSPLRDHIENAPEGFITPKGHPDLKNIEKDPDVEIYNIPSDTSPNYFIQKKALTS